MSASHAPALDAIAFQLAAALEEYEVSVGRMIDTWLDMELYGRVSEQIEEIRLYCLPLPQLSAPWVELLIAHAELVHALWRLRFQEEGTDRERLEEVRQHHTACVRKLRSRCLVLLSGAPLS
ncbi:hypothetical protein GCM10028796_28170 [Ramlibacter monticola]|uniref:Uncharacterized protein n=1 Tax=Ramlibacter monticola TaxID=1926872 RepID=A0A936Z4N7_9BURK|nr:hypothetical protein [Ramlibacter monticola]MBL0393869.1 hypothetical protein [Ramlibacter monticola]